MKDSTLFLAELWVGLCKINSPLHTPIQLTFRIGKIVAHSQAQKQIEAGTINFNTTLQLNIDRSALDTHRCSLSLTYPNGTSIGAIAGIALISIPQSQNIPLKTYKLMQCGDKKANIELSLNIQPLQESHNSSQPSSSSFHCSSEMEDFQRKVISPPQMFEKSSISEQSIRTDNFLLPPKASRQRQRSPVTISINSQTILQQKCRVLENECLCLKKLLKLEIIKNDQCNILIERLVEALQGGSSTAPSDELDQTLLIEELIQPQRETVEELKNQIKNMEESLEDLKKEKRQLEDLILKISDSVEFTPKKTRQMKSLGKSHYQDMQNGNIETLLKDIIISEEQMSPFRKKIHQQMKTSPRKSNQNISPFEQLKQVIKESLSEKKSLFAKIKSEKKIDSKKDIENMKVDFSKQGLLIRLKQKIERSFNSMISKKLNKDILIYQRGELIKNIEEILNRL